MKSLHLFICLVLVCASSCNKTQHVEPIDTQNGTKAGWTSIDFNIDYTIQFPADQYTGRGYQPRSASVFSAQPTFINRKDEQASISATFCDPLAYPCSLIQYGDTLKTPLPDSIPFRNINGQNAFLNNRATFGADGKLYAVLYYGTNPGVTLRPYEGRIYTVSHITGLPQHCGSTQFSGNTKQEVFDILSTIKPK